MHSIMGSQIRLDLCSCAGQPRNLLPSITTCGRTGRHEKRNERTEAAARARAATRRRFLGRSLRSNEMHARLDRVPGRSTPIGRFLPAFASPFARACSCRWVSRQGMHLLGGQARVRWAPSYSSTRGAPDRLHARSRPIQCTPLTHASSGRSF